MTIEFGNRLQELRKAHGYSQEELAEKLGVSRQAVSKWECGEASPDTDNLIELSKIYKISLDELVGNTPEVKQEVVDDDKRFNDDDDDDDDDDDEDEDDKEQHKNHSRRGDIIEIIISSVIVSLIIVAYVVLGAVWNLWGQAWVLFIAIPVVSSIVDAIRYRDPTRFLYPVFIVFIYLLLNCWLMLNMWHPLWVLFITIPAYYILAGLPKKIRKIKEKEN